jgi:hypothetical protein
MLPGAPQAPGPRRLSRVPRTTIRTFNAQYAGGFLGARSWTKSAFPGLRRGRTGSAPPLPPQGAGSLDDACSGFTHVADRAVASGPASHPASRPRAGASLPGTQASPRTGLTPAGRPEPVARYVMSNSSSPWHRAVSAHPSVATAPSVCAAPLLLPRSGSARYGSNRGVEGLDLGGAIAALHHGRSGRMKLRSWRRTHPDSSRMRSASMNSGSTPKRPR